MERDDPWDENDGEELEAEIMRADHAFGVEDDGTTAEEQRQSLSIDDALARERPEASVTDAAIVLEADGEPDVEDELVAEGFVEEDEFASPEDRAISERDRAPGATDRDDPHGDVEGEVGGARS
jgi:hypothetical protein